MKIKLIAIAATLTLTSNIAFAQINIGGFLNEANKLIGNATKPLADQQSSIPSNSATPPSNEKQLASNANQNCSVESKIDSHFDLKKIRLGMSLNDVKCFIPDLKEKTDPEGKDKYDLIEYQCDIGNCNFQIGPRFLKVTAIFFDGKLASFIYEHALESEGSYQVTEKTNNLINAFMNKYGKNAKVKMGQSALWEVKNEQLIVNREVILLVRSDFIQILENIKQKIADDQKRATQANKKNQANKLAEQL